MSSPTSINQDFARSGGIEPQNVPQPVKGNFFSRACNWIKDHKKAIAITAIVLLAIAAAATGLTALTILFTAVMVDIYIISGIIAVGIMALIMKAHGSRSILH